MNPQGKQENSTHLFLDSSQVFWRRLHLKRMYRDEKLMGVILPRSSYDTCGKGWMRFVPLPSSTFSTNTEHLFTSFIPLHVTERPHGRYAFAYMSHTVPAKSARSNSSMRPLQGWLTHVNSAKNVLMCLKCVPEQRMPE
ncbi:hypothetical protein ACTXT7_002629 [Hymenolepis weldensis]